MSKNSKTQYNWNPGLKNSEFSGRQEKNAHFTGSIALSGASKHKKQILLPENGRQTQSTMAGTTATGFQHTSSFGFEMKNEESGSLLPQVKTTEKQKMNFGRNTLYNPRPQVDLLNNCFAVGDPHATSQAASFLVRPTNKPESRRVS
jgi:hypothetical protein